MHFSYDTTATVISKLVSASARANILFGQRGAACPPAPTASPSGGKGGTGGHPGACDVDRCTSCAGGCSRRNSLNAETASGF